MLNWARHVFPVVLAAASKDEGKGHWPAVWLEFLAEGAVEQAFAVCWGAERAVEVADLAEEAQR